MAGFRRIRGANGAHLTSAAILSVCGIASAQLQNGDFEATDATGAAQSWTVSSGKLLVDSRIKVSGQNSGKLDGADGASVVYQDVRVQPGKAYVFSGQWRNGDKTAEFDVVSASISYLDAPGGREAGTVTSQDSGPVVSNWKTFQLTPIVVPANAGAVRITLKSRFGVGAFDGLKFDETDVTSAQATIAAAAATKNGVTPSGRLVGGGSAGVANVAGGNPIRWFDSLPTAQQIAGNESKPILVFFSDPDSELSQHFETAVLNQPQVITALAGYVTVKLPFAANRTLAYQLQVFRGGTVAIYDARGNNKTSFKELIPVNEFTAKLLEQQ